MFRKEYSLKKKKKKKFMCEAATRLEMKMPGHLLPLPLYTHLFSQWDIQVVTENHVAIHQNRDLAFAAAQLSHL